MQIKGKWQQKEVVGEERAFEKQLYRTWASQQIDNEHFRDSRKRKKGRNAVMKRIEESIGANGINFYQEIDREKKKNHSNAGPMH